jgi:predicted nucleic acid-binding protein
VTPTFVDSNVLIDVASMDPAWEPWSRAALEAAHERSIVVINAIVYAELAVGYATVEALDRSLPADLYRREAVPFHAAFLAAACYRTYRQRGGSRTSTLPDFFIGAHAAVAGYRLLTRDASRYRTYFPTLEIIAPD